MEKPMATTMEDAQALADAVAENGVACVVDYVMRYNQLFNIVEQLMATGLLGRLRRINFENYADDEGLANEHWFWNRDLSGGILIEHGVHFFDIYSHLAGAMPRLVRGLRTERARDKSAGSPAMREDAMSAEVLYENDVLATYYHAFDKPREMARTQALLAFDRGYICIEGWIALSLTLDTLVDTSGYARLEEIAGLSLTLPEDTEASQHAEGSPGQAWQGARRVQGEWRHGGTKEEVYRAQVRAALEDLILAMDDPQHRPKATLVEGIASLEVAVQATEDARATR